MENKIEITVSEYLELKGIAERVAAVRRLVGVANYYPATDILRLLDIEPAKVGEC